MSYLHTVESEVLIIVAKPEFNLICGQIPEIMERLMSTAKAFQEHQEAVLIHWEKINWVEFEERGSNPDTIAFSNKLFEISSEKYFIINLIGQDSRYNVYRGAYREDNPFQAIVTRSIQVVNPGEDSCYKQYLNKNKPCGL